MKKVEALVLLVAFTIGPGRSVESRLASDGPGSGLNHDDVHKLNRECLVPCDQGGVTDGT